MADRSRKPSGVPGDRRDKSPFTTPPAIAPRSNGDPRAESHASDSLRRVAMRFRWCSFFVVHPTPPYPGDRARGVPARVTHADPSAVFPRGSWSQASSAFAGPVLLLPEGIADRLTPSQLQAVIAHELCHVRRHDNLTAAIHMLVQSIFWFHPLMWWIGARLVENASAPATKRCCSAAPNRKSMPRAS